MIHKKTSPRGKGKHWIPFWEENNPTELFKERHDARKALVEDASGANRAEWNTTAENREQNQYTSITYNLLRLEDSHYGTNKIPGQSE